MEQTRVRDRCGSSVSEQLAQDARDLRWLGAPWPSPPPSSKRPGPRRASGSPGLGTWRVCRVENGAVEPQGCSPAQGGPRTHQDAFTGGEGQLQDLGLSRHQLADGIQQDKGAVGVQHGVLQLMAQCQGWVTSTGPQPFARRPVPLQQAAWAGYGQGYVETLGRDVLDGDLLYAVLS